MYTLEWGENPPKPPSQRWGGQLCPRMGGKSPQTPLSALGGWLHDKLGVKHRKYCLNTENVNFYSIIQKGASNKSFLSLNISHSYRNYALPHMTPTYPENIRLLGPSSWEEIGFQQTDIQTDHRNSPPFSLASAYYVQSYFVNFLYQALGLRPRAW